MLPARHAKLQLEISKGLVQGESTWIIGAVERQDRSGIAISSRLQPDFDAAGWFVRRASHLEDAGAHHGAVVVEAEAVAVLQPGHFISRSVEGPEPQGQDDAKNCDAGDAEQGGFS